MINVALYSPKGHRQYMITGVIGDVVWYLNKNKVKQSKILSFDDKKVNLGSGITLSGKELFRSKEDALVFLVSKLLNKIANADFGTKVINSLSAKNNALFEKFKAEKNENERLKEEIKTLKKIIVSNFKNRD